MGHDEDRWYRTVIALLTAVRRVAGFVVNNLQVEV
jgi:hypothetical protein